MSPERAVPDPKMPDPIGRQRRPYRLAATLDALVLGLLRQSNGPLTAYEIAQRAGERESPITPAQVYRVLDRLVEGNAVQRIELLSAYLPLQGARCGFMVCRCCRSVQPFPVSDLEKTVHRLCRVVGFRPSRSIFESWGVCAECDGKVGGENAPAVRVVPPMMTGGKGLLALMMAGGAMLDAAPVDAMDYRPAFAVVNDSATSRGSPASGRLAMS